MSFKSSENDQELNTILEGILPKERIRTGERMSAHTSFRTGGPADLFVTVQSPEELRDVLAALKERNYPWFILGRGTNILVGDGGFRGCVITLSGKMNGIHTEGRTLTCGAGAALSAAANAAREAGLSGLEFAAGIPGSVGGGLVMNAGAYGGEMKQVVTGVTLLMEDGTVSNVPASFMKFDYRTSILKKIPAVALSCTMALSEDDPAKIGERMQDLGRRRQEKQPLEYPSAGSTFKRPKGHFAGQLIEEAGLRGFSVGGACVSEKHCGFVINKDHATSRQIRDVIEQVQERVFENSGVMLEREVIFLGEF